MIEQLKNAVKNSRFDAILITSAQNRRYATGFLSSAGVCVVTKDKGYFFTDFRYIEAAASKIQNFEVIEAKRGQTYSSLVNEVIESESIKTIGAEQNSLSYDDFIFWKYGLNADVHPMEDIISSLRQVKEEREIECVISAQRIAEKALIEVLNDIKEGVTEKFIAARLTYLMLVYGAENMSFDPIVVSGKKSSMPHGVPDTNVIKNGDFITMDFGCIFDGYCSDMTRTVALGYVTEEMEEVYQTVLEAQIAGINTTKAGVRAKDVDCSARKIIEAAGYGEYFGHGFGHGIGIDIHEMPNAGPNSIDILQAGNIISAEPGIYIPDKFGVRIEDMLLVTDSGSQNLTNAPKNLIILP